ncbi:MAG: hypothetical protein QF412_05800, partial [Planctomycetota bacterium]|nr:hypothetical protein [Planctomycetota bacterium]
RASGQSRGPPHRFAAVTRPSLLSRSFSLGAVKRSLDSISVETSLYYESEYRTGRTMDRGRRTANFSGIYSL